MRVPPPLKERCAEIVSVPDTFRYTGRGPGFSMHYERRHCRRKAKYGQYCWQHRREER